ncbi:MAG: hypothetical protein IJG45_00200 [Oscillospiraceae bacterium]|nr:hypothetical protein [Oscillospiraceae bacterium]
MRSNIRWVVILLILTLLLSGCQNAKPEEEQSTENETQLYTERETVDHLWATAVSDTAGILETWETEKERIRAFWEAHRDELEAIAVEFIALAQECTNDELPYVQYRPDRDLLISDGLGKWETIDAPETEQKLRALCSLPDCPFENVEPSVSRAWLDTDFCGFSEYLPFCRLELLYFADGGYELSEWFDHEVLLEHWVILTDWNV